MFTSGERGVASRSSDPGVKERHVTLEDPKRPMEEIMDQLNAELKVAEASFEALRLGVSAEIPLEDSRHLGFGKFGRSWRLYVRHMDDQTQEVTLASRRTRIEAAGKLGQLKMALFDSSAEQLELARKAVLAVQDFNRQLLEELPD